MVIGPQIGFVPDLDALPIFDKPLWEEYMRFGETYVTMASRAVLTGARIVLIVFSQDCLQEKDGKYIGIEASGI